MKVSLPILMKNWVESQVETGQYSNASDYVRDLIRRDQQNNEQIKHLQNAIDKGISSGISDNSMLGVLKNARKQAKASSK